MEKRVVSTLEGFEHLVDRPRRSGSSTLLVDNAIQIIFRGDVCLARDSWKGGEVFAANLLLYERILKRLKSEFPSRVLVKNDCALTIELA